jgi:hypothetical protein
MTDEELLKYQLRNPPVMSMALSRNHLYTMMVERMNKAADLIEQLVAINEQLNAKLAKVEALVKAAFFEGNNGCEYVWTKTKTYQKLKEVTGDTDDQ